MQKLKLIGLVTVVCSLLLAVARAQETNAPLTILEAFEGQTGTVIIKGSAQIGSVSGQSGMVSVNCKESKDAGTGRKEWGIAIVRKEGEAPEDTIIIDYEELDSFLSGVDYISKVDYTVTPLPSFDAVYITRGGLRI